MNRSARRDDGLQRISTLTRWAAGGAIVLAGVFSAVVAKALPGRSSGGSGGTAQAPAAGTSAATAPANAGTGDGSSVNDPGFNAPSQVPDTLAPPPQLPARGSSRHTSTVVSGGS